MLELSSYIIISKQSLINFNLIHGFMYSLMLQFKHRDTYIQGNIKFLPVGSITKIPLA